LIVPDQKVIIGALNMRWFKWWWNASRMFLGTAGVCTSRHSDAQVSRDQRM